MTFEEILRQEAMKGTDIKDLAMKIHNQVLAEKRIADEAARTARATMITDLANRALNGAMTAADVAAIFKMYFTQVHNDLPTKELDEIFCPELVDALTEAMPSLIELSQAIDAFEQTSKSTSNEPKKPIVENKPAQSTKPMTPDPDPDRVLREFLNQIGGPKPSTAFRLKR